MDLQTPSRRATAPGVPTISLFTTTEDFKYLWMKYVVGFDLSVHCARCLEGTYSNRIHPHYARFTGIRLNEAPARWFYLCGVTQRPYRWKDNLHLAFIYKPGSVIQYDDGRTGIVIEDAERIEIKKLLRYDLEPHGRESAYFTCRNWRFAYQIVHADQIGSVPIVP